MQPVISACLHEPEPLLPQPPHVQRLSWLLLLFACSSRLADLAASSASDAELRNQLGMRNSNLPAPWLQHLHTRSNNGCCLTPMAVHNGSVLTRKKRAVRGCGLRGVAAMVLLVAPLTVRALQRVSTGLGLGLPARSDTMAWPLKLQGDLPPIMCMQAVAVVAVAVQQQQQQRQHEQPPASAPLACTYKRISMLGEQCFEGAMLSSQAWA